MGSDTGKELNASSLKTSSMKFSSCGRSCSKKKVTWLDQNQRKIADYGLLEANNARKKKNNTDYFVTEHQTHTIGRKNNRSHPTENAENQIHSKAQVKLSKKIEKTWRLFPLSSGSIMENRRQNERPVSLWRTI